MKRDIKFRAWDNEKKIFVAEGEIVFRNYADLTTIQVIPNCIEYIGDNIHDKKLKYGRFVIQQFTGASEAGFYGKEVWESDIIENADSQELQIVFWNEEKHAWYCRYIENKNRIVSLEDSLGNLNKVKGNIHEQISRKK